MFMLLGLKAFIMAQRREPTKFTSLKFRNPSMLPIEQMKRILLMAREKSQHYISYFIQFSIWFPLLTLKTK